MRFFSLWMCLCVVSGCGGGVGSTVLQDFGIQDRPDDYVSGADRVMETMRTVGASEIRRLNTLGRHGDIKYEEAEQLRGRFYKEVKVYTKAYPLDSQPVGRSGTRKERGFVGLIEYAYELRESPRFSNRVEASAASATIRGGQGGRERYRYRFGSGGTWNGAKGEKVR